jgi:hypothetical protein
VWTCLEELGAGGVVGAGWGWGWEGARALGV